MASSPLENSINALIDTLRAVPDRIRDVGTSQRRFIETPAGDSILNREADRAAKVHAQAVKIRDATQAQYQQAEQRHIAAQNRVTDASNRIRQSQNDLRRQDVDISRIQRKIQNDWNLIRNVYNTTSQADIKEREILRRRIQGHRGRLRSARHARMAAKRNVAAANAAFTHAQSRVSAHAANVRQSFQKFMAAQAKTAITRIASRTASKRAAAAAATIGARAKAFAVGALAIPGVGEVVLAIRASMALATSVVDASKQLRQFADTTNRANAFLTNFNGRIYGAFYELNLGDVRRGFTTAHYTEQTTVKLARDINRMRDQWLEYDISTRNLQNRAASTGAQISGIIGANLGPLQNKIDTIVRGLGLGETFSPAVQGAISGATSAALFLPNVLADLSLAITNMGREALGFNKVTPEEINALPRIRDLNNFAEMMSARFFDARIRPPGGFARGFGEGMQRLNPRFLPPGP